MKDSLWSQNWITITDRFENIRKKRKKEVSSLEKFTFLALSGMIGVGFGTTTGFGSSNILGYRISSAT